MLLMSYSGTGVNEVVGEIGQDAMVVGVEKAEFWQVHYGLCMANLRLRVRGTDVSGTPEDVQQARLRERVERIVRNKLGGGYGKGKGVRWEVTTMLVLDK